MQSERLNKIRTFFWIANFKLWIDYFQIIPLFFKNIKLLLFLFKDKGIELMKFFYKIANKLKFSKVKVISKKSIHKKII